jgi:hypothetical protein
MARFDSVKLDIKGTERDVLADAVQYNTLHMQERTPNNKFDIIKLDIEGIERDILADPASREVLCKATCIFIEVWRSALLL